RAHWLELHLPDILPFHSAMAGPSTWLEPSACIFTIRFAAPWAQSTEARHEFRRPRMPGPEPRPMDQGCVGEYKGTAVPSIPVSTNSQHLAPCLFDLELEPSSGPRVARVVLL